jgi:hypothetical protein
MYSTLQVWDVRTGRIQGSIERAHATRIKGMVATHTGGLLRAPWLASSDWHADLNTLKMYFGRFQLEIAHGGEIFWLLAKALCNPAQFDLNSLSKNGHFGLNVPSKNDLCTLLTSF